jgi:type I restriction enzyme, S subunit
MGRGRKPISNFNGSEWETVFYNSVGTYVQYINIQLSKEYKLEPLSNHLKIVGGYAFKTAEYKNQGIPIIRISDFNNEQIVLKDVVYYQEAKELDRYQLVEGDIIIALTGGTIAKLAIVQNGLGKIYLNQRVGKFQALKPDEFEVEYIYWLARSIQSIIKNLAWGAAIPNVSPKQIEALKFPFPPKETQRGIIDFLNDLKNNDLKEDKIYFNDLIENEIVALHEKQFTTSSISIELTHQLTLVKKLRQQLLQDAVQGKLVEQNPKDEPASELLKKIKAEKQKLIAEKKIKQGKIQEAEKQEELIFDIPKNWTWCTLDEISKNITDGTHQTPTYTKSGRIFLSAQNIKPFKFMPEEHKFVSEEAYEDIIKNRKPEKGDILIARVGAGIGEAAVINQDIDFCFYVSLGLVQPFKDFLNTDYLTLVINSPYGVKYAKGNISSKGGSAGNFNLGRIRSFLIPLPPLAEQERIVQKVEELMQYCNDLEASIKQSELQNSTLLQQVLREALRKEPVLESD